MPASPSFRVRAATPADAPAMGELGAELVRHHRQLDPQRFALFGEPMAPGYARFLGQQARDPEAIVLVAVAADDQVIGYVWARLEGRDWRSLRGPAGVLHDLAVRAADRRRGVGRALVLAALARLEERGVPAVVTHTAWRNEASRRLLESLGFRPTMVELTRGDAGRG